MNLLLALVPYRQSPVSVPLRGSGLMNTTLNKERKALDLSFRPLAGKWINEQVTSDVVSKRFKVSVPLRGSGLMNLLEGDTGF